MKRPPARGAGHDAGNISDSVENPSGMRPEIRARLCSLAGHCAEALEHGELQGGAWALLGSLAALSVTARRVNA